MSSDDEFLEQLDHLGTLVERIGGTVINRQEEGIVSSEINGQEKELTGHKCLHGHHLYAIAGHPDIEYFQLYYFLSLKDDIAEHISTTTGSDVDGELVEKLLDRTAREDMEGLKYNLYMDVSSPSYATSLHETKAGSLSVLEINKKLFPNSENFDISTFEEKVQALISGGSRGQAILSNSINVIVDEDNPNGSQVRISYPR